MINKGLNNGNAGCISSGAGGARAEKTLAEFFEYSEEDESFLASKTVLEKLFIVWSLKFDFLLNKNFFS